MSQPLSCPAGTVLFSPGQDCPGFVRVTRGTIRVTLTAANGREVVLYRVGPGDVCLQTFACLTEGRQYSALGTAETPVEGEILPHGQFSRRLTEDAGFRAEVLGAVARRFGDFEQLVEDVALTGFDARLARVLLRLTSESAPRIEITHDALASETASGRAFVSRRLRAFVRSGLVEQGRGWIAICDRNGLDRIAADDG
mgnify:CR=1 FL=1